MTTTFKELPNGAHFRTPNINEIIWNRGDGLSVEFYKRYNGSKLQFQKRDEFGGYIIKEPPGWNGTMSVYYRIEPDNVVETV